MLNLIKYELKGYYKDFIIVIGIIALISLFLISRINVWEIQAIIVASFMVSFAAAIVVFIWNIKIFSRDMYEDTGYLLCTLPQHGYSILASKLVSALIQALIVGAITMLFNYIILMNTHKMDINLSIMVTDIMRNVNPSFVVFMVLASFLEYFYFLLVIYFSIALSKVAIKKKKMGKMSSFIIFIIISTVSGKITQFLVETFPKDINLNMLSNESRLFVEGAQLMPINIAVTIFNIVAFTLMFLVTSHIIENKLDF
ncbi:hypothetical protein [Clostridium magnum]|uniref:ABC-2 family transporter protein n=1 Tax=Clostridium magnum DSM 2767 TaxID=1121326 RepID=A0A161XAC8_9CLOT|nr:hypothetical protein [Clostridium magnum]KZL91216.1 ABC-2 family transporter protein [Clostridium magnum DSM 2767]SHI33101.1 hypothetical protein SAMN02745944_04131 [Clostridium magnum DSM 2767]